MRLVKLVIACGLSAALVAACGIKAKPIAGTQHISLAPGNHAKVDNARAKHVKCLKQHHYRVREYLTVGQRLPAIQVGTLPVGPTIIYESTPGIAQGVQIKGQAQAAEVIGSSLLYPNGASDHELTVVENCASIGVTG
jgi:hypothetical protein